MNPKRVAIANRGEVALRVIRTCQEMGLHTILIHSTPDRSTTAFRTADECIEIPGHTPLETYLDIEKVVAAAKLARADLLHPGFGFLSENAAFAHALKKAGIQFIGPSAESIEQAGNKISAKEMAIKAKVPVTPAYTGSKTNPKALLAEAEKIGFPVIVKAASGGGGKGMKVVEKESEFEEQLASAQREAKSAFGSDRVFIEKYLKNPRHVEVQVFGDTHGNHLHFFERECSVQRRHQKIIEESPANNLAPELRDRILASALQLAKAAKYFNAGTVEFLVDGNEYFFMELNTRLQVEHPVTEFVCGVDLVRLQIQVALGEKLPWTQKEIIQKGHAMELRVYAENPENQFLPSTGRLLALQLPYGPHRRFDFGIEVGDEITPFYDPMIGKIITWAPSRTENLARLQAVLRETVIFGVYTGIEFLKAVLRHPLFVAGQISTKFLEAEFSKGFQPAPLSHLQQKVSDQARRGDFSGMHSLANGNGPQSVVTGLRYQSPWSKS